MRKFFLFMLAMLCVASTAMAERSVVDVQTSRTLNLNHIEKALKTKNTAKRTANPISKIASKANPSKVGIITGMRKADATTSIEGMWTFDLGDYYFESSTGDISYNFEAFVDGDEVWFEDPYEYELPFVAKFDRATNTLTFTRYNFGPYMGYHLFQQPYIFSWDIWDIVNVDEITATYYPTEGVISFDADNGIAWEAHGNAEGSDLLGWFSIYDLIGATVAQEPEVEPIDEAQEGKWESLGMASFVDSWMMPYYTDENGTRLNPNDYPYEVELQRSVEDKNVFRLWKPYTNENAPLLAQNRSQYEGQIVFDISDRNHVVVLANGMPAGFKNTYGDFYTSNELGWYINYGYEKDFVIDVLYGEEPADTYKNGVVTINTPMFDFSSAYADGYTWTYEPSYPSIITFPKEEGFDEAIALLQSLINRGNAITAERGDEALADLNIDVDGIITLAEVYEAIEAAKNAIANYIADIEVTDAEDITASVLVNATPVDNLDGWEGTSIGGHDNGVAEYWNVSGAGFHQTINLPAGEYRLSVVALTRTGMHSTIYAGDNSVEIVTVASNIVNSRAQAANWFAAGNGVNELFFILDEATDIEIGLKADDTTGDHWTVWQSFKVEKVNIERLMAVSDYTQALATAKALLANESIIGDGLFQIALTDYNALSVAVLGWELDPSETSTYKLKVAAEALEKAIQTYGESGGKYTFQNKATGLYLAVDNTREEELSNKGGQVYISEEVQEFSWTSVEGGITLYNEQGFVGYAGTTGWTMSASTGAPLTIAVTPVEVEGELLYTLNVVSNGKMIGTDDTIEGSPCYFDKGVANNGYWIVEKVGSTDPSEIGDATAIESVEEAEKKEVIFDLSGRRVSKAQKGIYIINGKKVVK